VDSIRQCSEYGEISHALKAGLIDKEQLVELGQVLASDAGARRDDQQITLVDLTGVAVQDTQIANCALASCAKG
jgi:ornithine cyclodeaminase